jgi:hypothetical protein
MADWSNFPLTITTDEGVGILVNQNSFITIYNLNEVQDGTLNFYPYIRLNTIFLGSFTTVQSIAPKFDGKGLVDSRFLIFVAPDSTIGGKKRMGVLKFERPLVDLLLASQTTPPLSLTIPFSGFKSTQV